MTKHRNTKYAFILIIKIQKVSLSTVNGVTYDNFIIIDVIISFQYQCRAARGAPATGRHAVHQTTPRHFLEGGLYDATAAPPTHTCRRRGDAGECLKVASLPEREYFSPPLMNFSFIEVFFLFFFLRERPLS